MRIARVQLLDEPEELVECRSGRQALEVDGQTGFGAGAHFVAHVDLRRRVLSDQHDAELRRPAVSRGERSDARSDRFADLTGNAGAVEQPRRRYVHVKTSSVFGAG